MKYGKAGKKTLSAGLFRLIISVFALMLAGCTNNEGQIMDGDGMFQIIEYKQISQDKAKEMMAKDDGHVIVDVRREDEYAEGHIPGAILIPNESIADTPPEELPDLDQIILVYCRSGRRSKEAAQKLVDMGYASVYEFGGIIDWTGEIEKEAKATDNETTGSMEPVAFLTVVAGDRVFSVDTEDNSSAEAFLEKLCTDPVTLEMHDYGGFEKVGELPWELPVNDKEITTKPGDL
ncbi:MAG: hypothetical protein K6E62_06655, partial [Lachnospiraceae bacterium]|nr:hypothetical protein [Lachnospiraceae bacterium]